MVKQVTEFSSRASPRAPYLHRPTAPFCRQSVVPLTNLPLWGIIEELTLRLTGLFILFRMSILRPFDCPSPSAPRSCLVGRWLAGVLSLVLAAQCFIAPMHQHRAAVGDTVEAAACPHCGVKHPSDGDEDGDSRSDHDSQQCPICQFLALASFPTIEWVVPSSPRCLEHVRAAPLVVVGAPDLSLPAARGPPVV